MSGGDVARPPYRVIKLGGSLLDLANLPQRVEKWLDRQSPAVNVFVVGGGAAVDALRESCRLEPLDETAADAMAIQAMSDSARQLAAAWPKATSIQDVQLLKECYALGDARPVVFEATVWIAAVRRTCDDLPRTWAVTSDSISARLAIELEAMELVLLKSALPVADCMLVDCATAGYVDLQFTKLAPRIKSIRFVNLRDDNCLERSFLPNCRRD